MLCRSVWLDNHKKKNSLQARCGSLNSLPLFNAIYFERLVDISIVHELQGRSLPAVFVA